MESFDAELIPEKLSLNKELGLRVYLALQVELFRRINDKYPDVYPSMEKFMAMSWDDLREVLENNREVVIQAFGSSKESLVIEGNDEILNKLAEEVYQSERLTAPVQDSRDPRMFQ